MKTKTKGDIVGYVAVDSGQVIIVDPCYLASWRAGDYNPDRKDGNHYAQACDITLTPAGAGQMTVSAIAGDGVVSRTHSGDGNYPVYADRDSQGNIKSLTIDFLAE